jgi:NAD(P)-dependent dehydrogenase (short-subunit alcohol dehydrogenase family)
MQMEFSGKVALVTGGANGIGLGAGQEFARLGARVMLVDRDAASGEAAAAAIRAAGCEAQFVEADVSRGADVERYVAATLDAYGAIDCFFNNAGIEGRVAPIAELDEAVFDAVIGVNLKGVFLGLRHVLPVMLRQGRGAVVNTASTAALVGSPGLGPYVASKHGVLGLTRTAAGEVAASGVRVNAVCPGPTDTRMIHSLVEQNSRGGDLAASTARYQNSIPLGRYATVDEVVAVVLFLCSDLSGSVTAAHYVVDGGRTGTTPAPRRPAGAAAKL